MGQGSKRKSHDVVLVRTNSTGSEAGASEYNRDDPDHCPVSLAVSLDDSFRKYAGAHVSLRADTKVVQMVLQGQVISSIEDRRKERLLACIKDHGLRYEGRVVFKNNKVYAELQLT